MAEESWEWAGPVDSANSDVAVDEFLNAWDEDRKRNLFIAQLKSALAGDSDAIGPKSLLDSLEKWENFVEGLDIKINTRQNLPYDPLRPEAIYIAQQQLNFSDLNILKQISGASSITNAVIGSRESRRIVDEFKYYLLNIDLTIVDGWQNQIYSAVPLGLESNQSYLNINVAIDIYDPHVVSVAMKKCREQGQLSRQSVLRYLLGHHNFFQLGKWSQLSEQDWDRIGYLQQLSYFKDLRSKEFTKSKPTAGISSTQAEFRRNVLSAMRSFSPKEKRLFEKYIYPVDGHLFFDSKKQVWQLPVEDQSILVGFFERSRPKRAIETATVKKTAGPINMLEAVRDFEGVKAFKSIFGARTFGSLLINPKAVKRRALKKYDERSQDLKLEQVRGVAELLLDPPSKTTLVVDLSEILSTIEQILFRSEASCFDFIVDAHTAFNALWSSGFVETARVDYQAEFLELDERAKLLALPNAAAIEGAIAKIRQDILDLKVPLFGEQKIHDYEQAVSGLLQMTTDLVELKRTRLALEQRQKASDSFKSSFYGLDALLGADNQRAARCSVEGVKFLLRLREYVDQSGSEAKQITFDRALKYNAQRSLDPNDKYYSMGPAELNIALKVAYDLDVAGSSSLAVSVSEEFWDPRPSSDKFQEFYNYLRNSSGGMNSGVALNPTEGVLLYLVLGDQDYSSFSNAYLDWVKSIENGLPNPLATSDQPVTTGQEDSHLHGNDDGLLGNDDGLLGNDDGLPDPVISGQFVIPEESGIRLGVIPVDKGSNFLAALHSCKVLSFEQYIEAQALLGEGLVTLPEEIALIVSALSYLTDEQKAFWVQEVGCSGLTLKRPEIPYLVTAALIKQSSDTEDYERKKELFLSFYTNQRLALAVFLGSDWAAVDLLMALSPESLNGIARKDWWLEAKFKPDSIPKLGYESNRAKPANALSPEQFLSRLFTCFHFMDGNDPNRFIYLFRQSLENVPLADLYSRDQIQLLAQEFGIGIDALKVQLAKRDNILSKISAGLNIESGGYDPLYVFETSVIFNDGLTDLRPFENQESEDVALIFRTKVRSHFKINATQAPTPYDLRRLSKLMEFEVTGEMFAKAYAIIQNFESDVESPIQFFDKPSTSWRGSNLGIWLKIALQNQLDWQVFIDAEQHRVNVLEGTVPLPIAAPSIIHKPVPTEIEESELDDLKKALEHFHWKLERKEHLLKFDDRSPDLFFQNCVQFDLSTRTVYYSPSAPIEIVRFVLRQKIDELQRTVQMLLPQEFRANYFAFDYSDITPGGLQKLSEFDLEAVLDLLVSSTEISDIDEKRIATAFFLLAFRIEHELMKNYLLEKSEDLSSITGLEMKAVRTLRDEDIADFLMKVGWKIYSKGTVDSENGFFNNAHVQVDSDELIEMKADSFSRFSRDSYRKMKLFAGIYIKSNFHPTIFKSLCEQIRWWLKISDDPIEIDCELFNYSGEPLDWPENIQEAIVSEQVVFTNLKFGMKEPLGLAHIRQVVEGAPDKNFEFDGYSNGSYSMAIVDRASQAYLETNINNILSGQELVAYFRDRFASDYFFVMSEHNNPLYASSQLLKSLSEVDIPWAEFGSAKLPKVDSNEVWRLSSDKPLQDLDGNNVRKVSGTAHILTEEQVVALAEQIKEQKRQEAQLEETGSRRFTVQGSFISTDDTAVVNGPNLKF